AKAAEMLLTSGPITGEEAVQLGLANRSFVEEDLLPQTLSIAKKIAKQSPVSVKPAIAMLQYSKHGAFEQAVKAEADSFGT
ncbi:enoyl-CoA hydratase-related protein, partial [Planococcus sp. SIMBA_143]